MIADKNRIYDGWINLEAGVDAGRAPQMIDINQVVSATNMTFRGGDISTRPGFRKLSESFPSLLEQRFCYGQAHSGVPIGAYTPLNTVPFPIPDWFVNNNSEFIYRNGILQGALAFSPHHGEDCIIASVGGRLFRIIPGVTTARVDEIVPDDPPTAELTEPYSFRNRSFLSLAYMVQADKWFIAQDGHSRAIIYDGVTARRSKISTDREHTEIPVGKMMAYGMGRICVVVNDRDVAFGDLYGSHDLTDPADSIIFFTERNFLAEGFDAAIPFQQGVATGITFFPQLDTSTGNGQLLVFAERGAASFFLSLPRELWKSSQFQILALLTTGMRGHRSIAAVNEDLWFRSDDGMRSFRQARSESTGWAHIPLSTNMRQFMENDSTWLLKYVSSIYFDNRVLTTVSPAFNLGRTFHNAIAVVDFDILSSFGTVATKPAWEGVWRFPNGIRVIQLLTGQFNGVTRAFAFCQDENLQNQLYEITKDDVNDWDNQCIEWEFVTRSMDFSRLSQQSTPFNEVELYDGDVWMKDFRRCGGSAEAPDGETPEPTPAPVNYRMVVEATVSGTAVINGASCSAFSPIAVSGTVSSEDTFDFLNGDPVPPSTEKDVFNYAVGTELVFDDGGIGGLCVGTGGGNLQGLAELTFVEGTWFLEVRCLIAANLGNPPDCAGVCGINNDSSDTIHDLGGDPSGLHVYDFVGDETGANYHIEVTVIPIFP